jgi:hypothetical protein
MESSPTDRSFNEAWLRRFQRGVALSGRGNTLGSDSQGQRPWAIPFRPFGAPSSQEPGLRSDGRLAPRNPRFKVREQVKLEQGTSHEPYRCTSRESQRDSVPKPGVGPRSGPTPGVGFREFTTPAGLRRAGATPLGLVEIPDPTRGSSFLATPGFGSQSLRD